MLNAFRLSLVGALPSLFLTTLEPTPGAVKCDVRVNNAQLRRMENTTHGKTVLQGCSC